MSAGKTEDPTAPMARVVDDGKGGVVLIDPVAVAVIRAIEKHNCRAIVDANLDRIEHFRSRMRSLRKTGRDVVIVLLDVDDPFGAALADVLMPGYNWQVIRDQGMMPLARGMASRPEIEEIVATADVEAAEKLRAFDGEAAVVVAHRGVVEIYAAEEVGRG